MLAEEVPSGSPEGESVSYLSANFWWLLAALGMLGFSPHGSSLYLPVTWLFSPQVALFLFSFKDTGHGIRTHFNSV